MDRHHDVFFFFQAEDGIRDLTVTGVQTCALPISRASAKYVAEQTAKERASPAEARAWFDTHRAEFEDPAQVHCLQLVVRTLEEAKSALDQLRAGASFDKLARQMSTSPDGRNGGGPGLFVNGSIAQGV